MHNSVILPILCNHSEKMNTCRYTKHVRLSIARSTSTAAISARVKPVPVSIEPKRESPILHEINCAPGATPFNKGS